MASSAAARDLLEKLADLSDEQLLGVDESKGIRWTIQLSKVLHGCTRLKNGRGARDVELLQVAKDRIEVTKEAKKVKKKDKKTKA